MQRHVEKTLPLCLEKMIEGVVHSDGQPLREGIDKGVPYDGLLIVANGDTLASRLRSDDVIHDEPQGFVDAKNFEQLSKYLETQQGEDGAYIFDGVNDRITRVMELNNNPPGLPKNVKFYEMMPIDFVSYDGTVQRANIGTKTRLAVKLPHAYDNTETLQIKRSPFATPRIGKVTHFTKQGLAEEFFFDYACNHGMNHDTADIIPFAETEKGALVGVYRRYTQDHDGGLYRPVIMLVGRNNYQDLPRR